MNVGVDIEALDQQAQLVIQRRIRRPAEIINALIGEPLPHGVEKSVGRFLIVAALEKSEKPPAFVVMLIVALVKDCRNPAANFAAPEGEKSLHRIAVIKRMWIIAHQLLLVGAQRGNPIPVALIQYPGELQKLFLLPPRPHRMNFKFSHCSYYR